MPVLAEKLRAIGGGGKLADCEWRIRCRLGWHQKAASAIRHLLYGERRASPVEARDIEMAHARWCAEKIGANRAENQHLIASIMDFAARAESLDAAYWCPHLEALRAALDRLGGESDRNGSADRS